MSIPLNLSSIEWTGGGLSRFEVRGRQAVTALLASDSSARVTFAHQVVLGYSFAEHGVSVVLEVEMQVLTGSPPQPTDLAGRFELVFRFTVENLPDLMVPAAAAEAEPTIHPQLALLLVSVAYSTARGILSVRLQGTPLEGVNLPLVDPKQLLNPPAASVPAR